MKFYARYIKRPIDFAVSLLALIILSPLLILILIIQIIIYRGKPFYSQPRPGKSQKIFKVIKFRTMYDAVGPGGENLSDDDRLSGFGRLLRASSLDEIPQLINVLKGDMSIVGPRPLLVEYLSLYNETQLKRHRVRPGVTGWAQVRGRNQIEWVKRFKLDVWYVENVSLVLDLKILWLTMIRVVTAEGISGEGTATMKKFKGNES